MLRKLLLLTFLVCFTLAAIPGDAMADRTRLKKPSEKRKSEPARISESRHMLTGFLAIGKLTGEVTNHVAEGKDELLYGFGFGYEYYLRPKIGFGGELRFLWLSTPEENADQIKSTEFRAFAIYRFRPTSAKTFYLKGGIGASTVKNAGWSVRDRTQVRLALGYLLFGSGRFNTRIELSFNRMLSTSDRLSSQAGYEVDYIALDIGLGLPL